MADKLEKMSLEKIKPEKFGDFDRIADEFLPSIHLNSDQVAELHNWKKAGNIHRVVMDIRQDDVHIDKVTGTVSGSFRIVAYKVLKKKSMDEMTDKEFGEFQGEELSKVSKGNASSVANRVNEK